MAFIYDPVLRDVDIFMERGKRRFALVGGLSGYHRANRNYNNWRTWSGGSNMIEYYFPYLVMGAILILVCVIWYVVVGIRAWSKERDKKKHPCKYCKRGHQCVGCPIKVVKDKEENHD